MYTNHPIIPKIKDFIKDKHLLKDKAKVIVGVSGGADSIALLHILIALGYECIVAHCNFHLRGQESYRDEYFVEKEARRLNVKFVSANFDTRKYIEDESISLEMAARELRYAWFEKIRNEYDAEKIAVAHHMNDSVETVLINLVRGSGIRGLSGISALNGNIIRPLLCIFREDIIHFLNKKNLKYVTDSTNKEDIYTRNKIRLNIIPLLKLISPSAVETIARTAENLAKTEAIYNHYINTIKEKLFVDNKINIDLLLQEPDPETILYEMLNPYGFKSATVRNILKSVDKQSGKIFYSQQYQLIKDRAYFLIQPIHPIDTSQYYVTESDKEITNPISLTIDLLKMVDPLNLSTSKFVIHVDSSKVNFPLIIRKWQQGDKFIPFGMNGHKKVSDFFTDNKLSIIDKNNIWLLCSGDKIIWIVGHRMDNRFRVTDKTQNVLRISYKEQNENLNN